MAYKNIKESSTDDFAQGTLVGVEAVNDSLLLENRGALKFNPSNLDYVDLGNSLNSVFTGGGEITIEVLLYPYAFSGSEWQAVVCEDFASSNSNVVFEIFADGTVNKWAVGFYNGSWHQVYGSSLTTNQWIHIAGTYDGNTLSIYIDGNLIDSVSDSAGLPAGDEIWTIGRRHDSWGDSHNYFDGEIAELRIWNVARTQQEIQDNMYKLLTGTETGLVAYYKFNEGSGTTLTDYAGTNDGTINGATWTTTSQFYIETGNRISPNIDLTSWNFIADSSIFWTENLNGQNIIIETRVSTDGGNSWSDWQACTNGGSIPNIVPNCLLQVRQTLTTSDITITPELTSLDIFIRGGAGVISGTVKENGSPVQRIVRAYLRSDGKLVESVSSEVDGTFTIYTDTLNEHYVVALDDITDENNYNALIFDRIIPGGA